MAKRLNSRQTLYMRAKVAGATNIQAVKMAGYNVKNDNVAGVLAHKLNKNVVIAKALEEAGLTTNGIATTLKAAIEAGVGVKATNSDAISGLRLASELHGLLKKDVPDSLNQTNIYINELKNLDDTALMARLNDLTATIKGTPSEEEGEEVVVEGD